MNLTVNVLKKKERNQQQGRIWRERRSGGGLWIGIGDHGVGAFAVEGVVKSWNVRGGGILKT